MNRFGATNHLNFLSGNPMISVDVEVLINEIGNNGSVDRQRNTI
jgi:hypothetical protein